MSNLFHPSLVNATPVIHDRRKSYLKSFVSAYNWKENKSSKSCVSAAVEIEKCSTEELKYNSVLSCLGKGYYKFSKWLLVSKIRTSITTVKLPFLVVAEEFNLRQEIIKREESRIISRFLILNVLPLLI